jgi:cytochrome b561
MWKVVLVFLIFFAGIAWLAFVDNKSGEEKRKSESSSIHKIVIGIAVLIGIIFVIGTLTEAFG